MVEQGSVANKIHEGAEKAYDCALKAFAYHQQTIAIGSRLLILAAVTASSLFAFREVLAQGVEWCVNLGCKVSDVLQGVIINKGSNLIVGSEQFLRAIGGNSQSCSTQDQILLAHLANAKEAQLLVPMDMSVAPPTINMCGVSTPAEQFIQLLDKSVVNNSQASVPEIFPALPLPTEAVVAPPTQMAISSEPSGLDVSNTATDLAKFMPVILGAVCGVPAAIGGAIAGARHLLSGLRDAETADDSDVAGVPTGTKVQGLSARQVEQMEEIRSEILNTNPFVTRNDVVEIFQAKGYSFVNANTLNDFLTARSEAYDEIIGVPMNEARMSMLREPTEKFGGPENLRGAIIAKIVEKMR